MIVDEFNRDDVENLNVFVNRVKTYNPKGRYQTEDEAKQKDKDIKDMLAKHSVPYIEIDGDRDIVNVLSMKIFDVIQK